jgi:hypothetical protein
MAQGNLAVGGLGVSGKDGSKLTVNVPTVGRIADGASVERAVATGFDTGDVVRYNLAAPDFLTANRVRDAINKLLPGTALVEDAVTIALTLPADTDTRSSLMAMIEMIEVTPRKVQTMADSLPALGIVAAVLGIVKTMGSIDQPPSVLGGMIGAALVGTFLGVFLAYGIVAPMAGRLKQVNEQDEQIFHAVKQAVIASLHGWPQPLVVESARSGLGHAFRPGLSELLDAMRGK